MSKTEKPALIGDLAHYIWSLHNVSSRLRLAVTPKEHAEIRDYCLETSGVFYNRIGNVPLVVEEQADNPPLSWEVAP